MLNVDVGCESVKEADNISNEHTHTHTKKKTNSYPVSDAADTLIIMSSENVVELDMCSLIKVFCFILVVVVVVVVVVVEIITKRRRSI